LKWLRESSKDIFFALVKDAAPVAASKQHNK
jgi:hypothetical protein